MSVQRSELYHFSAVDIFLELLKRRICYYTKKVQQSDGCDNMIGANEKFSLRLIRSKLRKREESSGVLRTNVVHPEGVLQATVVETSSEVTKPSLEDVFVTSPVSNRTSLTQSECSLSASSQSSDSSYLPMFLYSTGNSRNSLNSSDQNMLVHSSGPAEDIENNNHSKEWDRIGKKNVKGKIMKLVRRKTPPAENYALPLELREQLKQIYVY